MHLLSETHWVHIIPTALILHGHHAVRVWVLQKVRKRIINILLDVSDVAYLFYIPFFYAVLQIVHGKLNLIHNGEQLRPPFIVGTCNIHQGVLVIPPLVEAVSPDRIQFCLHSLAQLLVFVYLWRKQVDHWVPITRWGMKEARCIICESFYFVPRILAKSHKWICATLTHRALPIDEVNHLGKDLLGLIGFVASFFEFIESGYHNSFSLLLNSSSVRCRLAFRFLPLFLRQRHFLLNNCLLIDFLMLGFDNLRRLRLCRLGMPGY